MGKRDCKGCYAVTGNGHPMNAVTTDCRCELGHKTAFENREMIPLEKCKKVKSWKELERSLKWDEKS